MTCVLIPCSLQVLEQHLACAALEHPLSLFYDEKFFGSGLNSAIMSLKSRGHLSYDPSCDSSAKIWNYIGHEVCYFHYRSLILLFFPFLISLVACCCEFCRRSLYFSTATSLIPNITFYCEIFFLENAITFS